MKVCDVVLNSVWYDPRVRKQIAEYIRQGIDIVCVGLECNRYDEEKVKNIPCETIIIKKEEKYKHKFKSIIAKINREIVINNNITDAIISCKPDVIHANDLNALIPAYKAAKKLKCRLVYDSHEICAENFVGDILTLQMKIYSKVLKFIERYIVRRVDLMVCVSNATAEYFEQTYNVQKPLVVTNCSLDREKVAEPIVKHDGFEILNHGQFYEGRGYDIMVETAKLMKEDFDLKFAIRGFGKMEQKLREEVETNNLNNFVFYPPVKVEELISYAAKSHVGVAVTVPICLNFKLTVSNKLFEYVSAGLPVIMSDIPEHRYLNDKYHFGVIMEDLTPEGMKDAIKRLYENPSFYIQCCENAKKMSSELTWENNFGELIRAENTWFK